MPSAGTAKQSGNQAFNQTSTTTFKPATPQEAALLEQFRSLGSEQFGALSSLLAQAMNGNAFAMNPESQAQFDTSYKGAEDRLRLENKDYADFLAGGRGLRLSDTPISQQALQRQALGWSDLLGQKARAQLELGLAGNQFSTGLGLAAAQALPASGVAAFNPLYNERMASGTTTTSGTGSSNMTYQQPLMQTILQGTQAFNQFGQGLGSTATGIGKGLALFG